MFGKSSFSSAPISGLPQKTFLRNLSVLITPVVNIVKALSKFILLSSTGAVSLIKAIPRALSVLSISLASLVKIPNKLLSVASTATVSYIRARLVYLTVVIQGINNNVSGAINGFILNSSVINGYLQGQQYFVSLTTSITRVLTLQVASVATLFISKAIAKIMAIISNVTLTIKRYISIALSVISATITTLLAVLYPIIGAVSRYTFVADFKDRLIEIYKERNAVVNLRDRMQNLYKLRNVLANKRQQKADK
jgi:hypothetical protein